MSEIKVGDIVYTSWGYDQTNIDFYQVVGQSGKVTFELQGVGQKIDNSNDYADYVVPDTTNKIGETFKKRLGKWGSFKIEDFARASLWDGKPKYQTSFGYGH